jgi:RNA polymerase sporulation-specific sigma factor
VLFDLLGTVAEAALRCLSVVAGYVSNSSTFPQPLSEDEEARYLAKLQGGDDEARAILIERNLRLVAHIVNASW